MEEDSSPAGAAPCLPDQPSPGATESAPFDVVAWLRVEHVGAIQGGIAWGAWDENDLPTATKYSIAADAIERLRGLVYALSDALTDEGPDWSDNGLQNLRSRCARELPDVEWLQPYLAKAHEAGVAESGPGSQPGTPSLSPNPEEGQREKLHDPEPLSYEDAFDLRARP